MAHTTGSLDNAQQSPAAGLILREQNPLNLESPQSALRTWITPADQFYVRSHFAEPDLDRSAWRLTVEGAVSEPGDFSFSDLSALAAESQVAVMECAGNGRVFLSPQAEGTQWQVGAAGNAEYTGVPLAALLARVGVLPTAVDVIFEGADFGQITDAPASPGEIHFAHSIPVATARAGQVLLAYRMNGADLTRSHGFPVRVVVPGWYGMASVKWLTRIVVADRPFQGFFQSMQYSGWERTHGAPTLVPVTELQVKSIIVDPEMGGVVPSGGTYIVRGQAWTGEGTVTLVEISVDDGSHWAPARLTSPELPRAWRSWEFDWRPTAGRQSLMARATDSRGRVQPMDRDTDRRSYEINHVIPTAVVVRDRG